MIAASHDSRQVLRNRGAAANGIENPRLRAGIKMFETPCNEISSIVRGPMCTDSTSDERIVLIVDNPADVLLVDMTLREGGISQRFESGVDAVEALCGRNRPGDLCPGVILPDLNTPRSDVFATLASLRESPWLSDVPVAILTSSRARSAKLHAELHGGTRLIEKLARLIDFLISVSGVVRDLVEFRPAKSQRPSPATGWSQ